MYLDATQCASVESNTTQDTNMDLDASQTRRLYLAGTVAFPSPFPSAGTISIVEGSVLRTLGSRRHDQNFVCIQEKSLLDQTMVRVVLKEDVAAIYFPGVFEDTEGGRTFRFAASDSVRNMDEGLWFFDADINSHNISARLGVDISCRESGAQGILFVPEHRPVLTIHEWTQTAGAATAMPRQWSGCTRC